MAGKECLKASLEVNSESISPRQRRPGIGGEGGPGYQDLPTPDSDICLPEMENFCCNGF